MNVENTSPVSSSRSNNLFLKAVSISVETWSLISIRISQSESFLASPLALEPKRMTFAAGSIFLISFRIRYAIFEVLLFI